MPKSTSVFAFLICCFSLLVSAQLLAQDNGKAKASPAASATGKIGQATVAIAYHSPAVKGRKIWGDLVPYNKVWRAGANEATTFTTDRDLMVEGKKLPAGTYALFAIPAEQEWTIIFNKKAKQWGAYEYDAAQDALRVKVKPVKAAKMNERLTYTLDQTGFSLNWENLKVPVRIK